MQVRMIGIDHVRATIDYREAFSFTKQEVKDALANIKEWYNVKGCIILSTCNRTELWISTSEKINIEEMICRLKNVSPQACDDFFVERKNDVAINHILNMACGFDSKLFGEDQIISQISDALTVARECSCTDTALEKIFQNALAAGKRVKTEVKFSKVNPNSAKLISEILKEKYKSLKGLECLVIGNGQMGQLVVNELIENGASVSMTLRKKFHEGDEQKSIAPEGCNMVPFEQRFLLLPDKQVIVSATLSNHYTLKYGDIAGILKTHQYYMFDLAVPRDIDPEIGKCKNVELLNIDTMTTKQINGVDESKIECAKKILSEYETDLNKWFGYRKYVPTVNEISELVAEDAKKRFLGYYEVGNSHANPEALKEAVRMATSKLIYGLKDTLAPAMWSECIESLHIAAAKETLKH